MMTLDLHHMSCSQCCIQFHSSHALIEAHLSRKQTRSLSITLWIQLYPLGRRPLRQRRYQRSSTIPVLWHHSRNGSLPRIYPASASAPSPHRTPPGESSLGTRSSRRRALGNRPSRRSHSGCNRCPRSLGTAHTRRRSSCPGFCSYLSAP